MHRGMGLVDEHSQLVIGGPKLVPRLHVCCRLIQERTKAGLAAARARGRTGGRPRMSADDRRIVLTNKLFKDKSIDVDDTCATLKISKSALYRSVGIESRGSRSSAGVKNPTTNGTIERLGNSSVFSE